MATPESVGHGLETAHGTVIDAKEIGPNLASLKPVKAHEHGPLSSIAKTVRAQPDHRAVLKHHTIGFTPRTVQGGDNLA